MKRSARGIIELIAALGSPNYLVHHYANAHDGHAQVFQCFCIARHGINVNTANFLWRAEFEG